MRVTINLPDDLILLARKAAQEADTTVNEVIVDTLRAALSERSGKQLRRDFKIIAYGSGGLLPGADLDNTSALLDLMDGIDDPERR